MTNHKPDTTFFTYEESYRIFSRHVVSWQSLVAGGSNTALGKDFEAFSLMSRKEFKIQRKTPSCECKMTKYQQPKQYKHNNRLDERKPCKCRLKTLVMDLDRF